MEPSGDSAPLRPAHQPAPSTPPPGPPGPPAARATRVEPVFDTQNILWTFGALTASSAGVALVSQVHASARGFWILLVSLAFLAAYGLGSVVLLRAGKLVPGGVVASTAVSFVPLAAVGFERLIGAWPAAGEHVVLTSGPGGVPEPSGVVDGSFDGHGFAIAAATIVAGLVVYALVRYAFVFAWVVVASIYAIQLVLPAIDSHPSGADRADSFLVTGLLFVAIGLYADLVHARRIAFWWHLAGLATIAGGFVYDTIAHDSPGWVFVLLAGLIVLAAALPLRRATWGTFGLLGTWAPMAYYSEKWFGTLGTAFALFVVGLTLVGIGLVIQQGGDRWTEFASRRPTHA